MRERVTFIFTKINKLNILDNNKAQKRMEVMMGTYQKLARLKETTKAWLMILNKYLKQEKSKETPPLVLETLKELFDLYEIE